MLNDREALEAFSRRTSRASLGQFPRSFMGVPLVVSDKVIGAMVSLSYDRENYFNQTDLSLFKIIGSQVAVAMENARLFEKVKELAATDVLTGLNNRRQFFLLAEVEVGRAARYQRPLTGIMLDLDRFKKVNDTYGHKVGDQVLQMIARLCLQSLREVDIIGRYGGEEFAIILPEASLAKAHEVAERLRRKIASTEIETSQGSVKVTASLGLAELDPDHPSLEHLLDCADRALYAAKQSGRNQTKVYSEVPSS